MSTITLQGGVDTSPLMQILEAQEIEPGSQASYELCKLLWECHPLGGKLVEKPIALAQSVDRAISIPGALEDKLKRAFEDEWKRLGATNHIRDLMHISRAYGAGAVMYGFPDLATDQSIDLFDLAMKPGLYFNTYDPLNLAGSIVTNQNPNAPDFQKPNRQITAAGQPIHSSRSITVFHGTPIYISYQSSSFSFSGRSVFLRTLASMKSYITTMGVADMVSRKAGLLVAKLKQNGSILDGLMAFAAGVKRNLLKEGVNGQVLSIDVEENIESLNLQNTNEAMTTSRDAIIADIAAASDVPAIIIKDEAFAQGFANGDQDMMAVVQFVNGIRTQMQPAYEFFDRITMYRAWNVEFFATLQAQYDELANVDYRAWFYAMRDTFEAKWPSLIQEPEGEVVKHESEKLKAATEVLKTLAPILDPANKARLVAWFAEALNNMPKLFTAQFIFDEDALASYEPPAPVLAGPGGAPGEGSGNGD